MKKLDLKNKIDEITKLQITKNITDIIGIDALILSVDLNANRANISRYLNQLWNEREVIKVNGRPTQYISYSVLSKAFKSINLTFYYNNLSQFHATLRFQDSILVPRKENIQLYETQRKVAEIISYRYYAEVPLLEVERGFNLEVFLSPVFQKLRDEKVFTSNDHLLQIHASFLFENNSRLSSVYFGKNIDSLLKSERGLLLITGMADLSLDERRILNRLAEERLIKSKNDPAFNSNHHIIYIMHHGENLPDVSCVQKIYVPKFNEISFTDQLNYIIQVFKDEAKEQGKDISIHKDLFKTFCFHILDASYEHLHKILRNVIMQASYRTVENGQKNIEILWKDFSSTLLIDETIPKNNPLNILNSFVEETITFESSGYSKIDYIFTPPILNELRAIINNIEINDKAETLRDLQTFIQRLIRSTNEELQSIRLYCNLTNFYFDFTKINIHKLGFTFISLTRPELNSLQENYEKVFESLFQSKINVLLLIDARHNTDTYIKLMSKHDIIYKIVSLANPKPLSLINEYLSEFGRYADVIIVTDITLYQNLNELLSKTISQHVLTLYPLSLPLLEEVVSKIEKQIPIESFAFFDVKYDQTSEKDDKISETTNQRFLELLKNNILKNDLNFLDPNKAVSLLYTSLTNILREVHYPTSKEIIVKFIVHTCFAIERCIRNEPIDYPEAKKYYRENEEMISIIYHHLISIEQAYRIKFPPMELAHIADIFKY